MHVFFFLRLLGFPVAILSCPRTISSSSSFCDSVRDCRVFLNWDREWSGPGSGPSLTVYDRTFSLRGMLVSGEDLCVAYTHCCWFSAVFRLVMPKLTALEASTLRGFIFICMFHQATREMSAVPKDDRQEYLIAKDTNLFGRH